MATRPLALALALLSPLACGGDDDDDSSDSTATPDAAGGAGEPDAAPEVTCQEDSLETSLAALPGVSMVSEMECGEWVAQPARCFRIDINQPVQHAEADGASFSQRLFLMHRGCDRPTVVADWGYSNEYFYDDELSVLYRTNSLWVEHRYQGWSLPELADWDWTALTIENGAGDLHGVIAAFRPLYQGRWVSTGASKGGITATYHAYFFPDDLDGAVPYVAPASRARIDPEYQAYLDDTLTSACARRIRNIQVAALTSRRAMMIDRLTEFTGPGAEAQTLEVATESLDWSFWQAYGASNCDQVPRATASDNRFWQFYLDFSYLGWIAAAAPGPDETRSFGSLYYEWLTEQGFALQVGSHVAPLLEEPQATMEDSFGDMFPEVTLPAYDGSVTAAVRAWAESEAEDLLLIYGQFDPWSGGALAAPAQPTSARFFVPAATHAASIGALPEPDQAAALAHASRMLGEEPVNEEKPAARRAAEIRQAILDRQLHRQLATRLRLLRSRRWPAAR